ncbi:MAG: hypothetical protein N0C84_00765 [Candidatus Thiodiazotropha taylori]|uniref:Uncharacterized protein n=1 Tax=Candidatus Thiodiazotropha taylori TaxID=2792791 RepID=A0A9E4N1J7_9GAMM|nr:hypothetical protein [Candidatus Thiodiazotropha taylori]MCW4254977.1 hypothetical protein [Candidatus Thiodiazotropha taylori]
MSKGSTSSGRKFELEVCDRLDQSGIKYEDQPKKWPDQVSATVKPDFRIDLETGPLWVFAGQDFYDGGQQSQRLDHVISMDRYVWESGSVFYVVKNPGGARPDAKRLTEHVSKRSDHYDELVKKQVVGTLDQLMERISAGMSKN